MRQVRELIHATPSKVNEADPTDGSTPLMHAAICGRVDMASMLVSQRADINAQDKHSGWTALMQAVFHRYKLMLIQHLASKIFGFIQRNVFVVYNIVPFYSEITIN